MGGGGWRVCVCGGVACVCVWGGGGGGGGGGVGVGGWGWGLTTYYPFYFHRYFAIRPMTPLEYRSVGVEWLRLWLRDPTRCCLKFTLAASHFPTGCLYTVSSLVWLGWLRAGELEGYTFLFSSSVPWHINSLSFLKISSNVSLIGITALCWTVMLIDSCSAMWSCLRRDSKLAPLSKWWHSFDFPLRKQQVLVACLQPLTMDNCNQSYKH